MERKVLKRQALIGDTHIEGKRIFEHWGHITNILRKRGVQSIFAKGEFVGREAGTHNEIVWYADTEYDVQSLNELDRADQEKLREIIKETAQQIDDIINVLLQSSSQEDRENGRLLSEIKPLFREGFGEKPIFRGFSVIQEIW
ncbi:hypothetical protein N9174_02125 [bacterium]|nr:hypothetical protein [bacterium]